MYIEAVIALVIITFLRKALKTSGFVPQKDKQLVVAMAISIGFLALGSINDQAKVAIGWLAHGLLLWIVYILLTWQEFRAAKSLVYAISPILIIRVINDITALISSDFHEQWENYFDTAQSFAFVWMFAMWFVTNRQRKALEKEKLKAQEKEKEYKITEALRAELEVQVTERTTALTQQKNQLEQTISELKATQTQLIQAEKMASLGELTAGIAHEIQNPLNFVNNFSEVNKELLLEMKEAAEKGNLEEIKTIANDVINNQEKINHHGKRADAIVKGMLQHSRTSTGQKEPTDINALVDEYLRLAYHGLRAKDKTFNATMKTNFDERIGSVAIIPQDMGRAILNLITNAFYAVSARKKQEEGDFAPTVTVSTEKTADKILISVTDNGNGIPESIKEKIFQPFFTTKPTGQGTGLGLSLSYDIIKAHGGTLTVETKTGEGSEFRISIPANI